MPEEPEKTPIQTILIVDDTPTNIDVLDQFLEKEGYKISVAQSGEAALDLALRIVPDLILLDVMMPGIDGFAGRRWAKSDSTFKAPGQQIRYERNS